MRVRFLLCAILLGEGAFALAQEPQYFEAPASPHLEFHWDLLSRYDRIDHLKRPNPLSNEIERGRFEFRPEVDLVFSDRFKLGVRAVGDLGTDHNEDNAINFDNYRSRGATVERYYLEAKPGDFTLRAGSFEMPLLATELLWDRDIQTPGLAASWQLSTGSRSSLTVAAAGFYGPQRDHDHTRIGVGQLVWRFGEPDRLALEAAASYWHFEPEDLKPSFIRQNYFVTHGAVRDYLSRYRIFDAILRLRFSAGKIPVTISLDGLVNTGVSEDADEEKSALEGSLFLGRVGTPGNWRFFYTFQYVERDAVLGAYNTDDWWFHSWYRGHRMGIAITILPRVFVQGVLVFQQRLDLPSTLNRITLDVVKMF